ncbi:MAG: PQQ-binding-like beta-propeller repeat protein [Pirellulaceae bacterium]
MAIFDRDGKLEWRMELSDAPHDLHWLPNGHILTHQKTEVIEIDPATKEIVWSIDAKRFATRDRVEVHSVAPLRDNDVMIALSGEGKILEIDREGNVKHSILLQRSKPDPHRDTRLVRPLESGNYLVAQESDGAVREYDRNGEVVWEYDVPMFGREAKRGHGPDAFGNDVFCAIRLNNGNTLIATGNGHSVLEVNPSKEIVWKLQQHDLKGITLGWVTTLEVHLDGGLIIGNCHAGPENPQLVKINRDKEVLWQFRDFETLGNSVSNSITLDAKTGVIR